MRARLIPLLLMLAFVLLATSLLTPAAAQPVSQSIRLPAVLYRSYNLVHCHQDIGDFF